MTDTTIVSHACSLLQASAVPLTGRVASLDRAPQSDHVDSEPPQGRDGFLIRDQSEQHVIDLDHRGAALTRPSAGGHQKTMNALTTTDTTPVVVSFDHGNGAVKTERLPPLVLMLTLDCHSQLIGVDLEAREQRDVDVINERRDQIENRDLRPLSDVSSSCSVEQQPSHGLARRHRQPVIDRPVCLWPAAFPAGEHGPAGGREDLIDRMIDRGRVEPERAQDRDREPVVDRDQTEQQMLRADPVLRQPLGLAQRELQHTRRAWRERDLTVETLAGQPRVPNADLIADTISRDTQRAERARCEPVVLIKQTEQQMLGADVPLPGVTRLVAGQDNDLTRAICEPLPHTFRIAARHAHRKSGTGRRASTSRLLMGAVPRDRLTHRLNIDAKQHQRASRLLIVSHRRQEIPETELRPTVTEGAAAGSRQQPADYRIGRDDPGLRPRRPRYLGTSLHPRREHRHHCCTDRGLVCAQTDKNLHRDTVAVASQTKEKVPGSDGSVPETQRLAQRQLQHLLRARCERDLTLGTPITWRDELEHPLTRSISRHPKRVQRPAGVAVGIGEQGEQLMLGPDLGMPELPGHLLSVANNLPGGLCEPFKHERQASHHSPALTSSASTEKTILGQRARMPGFRLAGPAGLPTPTVADRRTGASRSLRSLPLAHGLGSASGRSAGVWAYVNHRIPTRREPQMSASAPAVNSVTLVGNLTADPVLKQLDDDRRVCNLRVAVNDQKDQPPMFIDVATFGAQADACAKYLAKGRAIAVTGRLVYREWDDNGTRRSRHHIIGRVQFGGKPDEPAADTSDAAEEVAAF